jgi:hypothetical protein
MFGMISGALCDDAVFGFSNVTLVSLFFISYIIVSFTNEELFIVSLELSFSQLDNISK